MIDTLTFACSDTMTWPDVAGIGVISLLLLGWIALMFWGTR